MTRSLLGCLLVSLIGSLVVSLSLGQPSPQDEGVLYRQRLGVVPTHAARPIGLSRSDLAQRLGISAKSIEVVTVHKVAWPDRCLGLLAQDEPCDRVSTPGYRIVLRAGDREYRYHSDLSENHRFAGLNDLPTAIPRPIELIREQLAAQLGLSTRDVLLIDLESTVWPDTCLGLPAPELCVPGETPGYRVIFLALEQAYRYHTDRDEMYRFAGPGDVPKRPM